MSNLESQIEAQIIRIKSFKDIQDEEIVNPSNEVIESVINLLTYLNDYLSTISQCVIVTGPIPSGGILIEFRYDNSTVNCISLLNNGQVQYKHVKL